jgi:hypothetical protein
MIIIGVNFHPEFQQIASVDTAIKLRATQTLCVLFTFLR